MDARKQDRRGIVIVIAVLLVVGAWWLWFFPRTDLYKIKNHIPDSDLEKTLHAIPPPAGAKLVKIEAMATSPRLPPAVVGFYTAPAGVDTVESYYKQEFPRHGFVYQPKAIPGVSDTTLLFCAPSYMAMLSLSTPDGDVLTYRILLDRRDGPC